MKCGKEKHIDAVLKGMNMLPHAACVIDVEGTLLHANEPFIKRFGEGGLEHVFVHHNRITKLLSGLHEKGNYAADALCRLPQSPRQSEESHDSIDRLNASMTHSPSMDIDIPRLAGLATSNAGGGQMFELAAHRLKKPLENWSFVVFTSVERYRRVHNALYKLLYHHHNVIKCMYPKHVTDVLTQNDHKIGNINDLISRMHQGIAVCFSDIVGFTSICSRVTPREIMTFLNDYFSCLDGELSRHNIFRYETIGDCYVCVAGFGKYNKYGQFEVNPESSVHTKPRGAIADMFRFAKRIIEIAASKSLGNEEIQVRVGIHSGSVASGIIDHAMPKYSLFGDTMNMASRMESSSVPSCINISDIAYNLLDEDDQRGFDPQIVDVKGKGSLKTWIFRPAKKKNPKIAAQASTSPKNQFLQLMALTKTTAVTSEMGDCRFHSHSEFPKIGADPGDAWSKTHDSIDGMTGENLLSFMVLEDNPPPLKMPTRFASD